jgi:hypothetical protein
VTALLNMNRELCCVLFTLLPLASAVNKEERAIRRVLNFTDAGNEDPSWFRELKPLLNASEVGLTAKFSSRTPSQTDRLYLILHNCHVPARCPPLESRPRLARKALAAMGAPPLAMAWVDEFEQLLLRDGIAPGLTIGVAGGSAKMYLGYPSEGPKALDVVRRHRLPNLPLSRS